MERDKNYDLELAKYIWSILKSNLPVLMSWGVEIETVKVITCGLEFRVNGFKHTGKVQIVLNEGADLFEVYLLGEDGEIRDKREDIYFDMLVSVVDELVEKTDDYEKRISDTYNIIKYQRFSEKSGNVTTGFLWESRIYKNSKSHGKPFL